MAKGVRVLNVPKGQSNAPDMSGFGVALAGLIAKMKREKADRAKVAAIREYANALENARQNGATRRIAMDIPVPDLLKNSTAGFEAAQELMDARFPRSENPPTSFFTKKGEFVKRTRMNLRPEGTLTREELMAQQSARKSSRESKPSLADKKLEILNKVFANERAIAFNKPPPNRIEKSELEFVTKDLGGAGPFNEAMRALVQSDEFYRRPAPTKKDPNKKVRTTIEEKAKLLNEVGLALKEGRSMRDVTTLPPGVTEEDAAATFQELKRGNPKLKMDSVLDQFWEAHDAGTDFTTTEGFKGQGEEKGTGAAAVPVPRKNPTGVQFREAGQGLAPEEEDEREVFGRSFLFSE